MTAERLGGFVAAGLVAALLIDWLLFERMIRRLRHAHQVEIAAIGNGIWIRRPWVRLRYVGRNRYQLVLIPGSYQIGDVLFNPSYSYAVDCGRVFGLARARRCARALVLQESVDLVKLLTRVSERGK